MMYMYWMGLRLYGSRQLANGWRGGGHQPTDLHVISYEQINPLSALLTYTYGTHVRMLPPL